MLRQPSENFGNVLPGVDDHGLAGGLIALTLGEHQKMIPILLQCGHESVGRR